MPHTVEHHGTVQHPELSQGMQLDRDGTQLFERPPTVANVPHVIAWLDLTPFIGEQVGDTDHIWHVMVKMESLGMHYTQGPDLDVAAGFLADFPQDPREYGFGGLEGAADNLPLVRTVLGRRGE